MSPTRPTSKHVTVPRSRWLAFAAAGAVALAGCGSASDGDGDPASATQPTAGVVTTDDPGATPAPTEPATSDVLPTDPPATDPPATDPPATESPTTEAPPMQPPATEPSTAEPTTTVADPSEGPTDIANDENESRIAQANAVAATSDGVLVTDRNDEFTIRVLDDTTQGLALLAIDLVIYQAGTGDSFFSTEGPIIVATDDRTETFTDGDRLLTLHDVGTIDGATKILASSEFAQPVGPEQADHRLLLIDANDVINGDDVEVADLGSFGGWESFVAEARFGDDAISLIRSDLTARSLQIIEYDGTIRHDISLPSERNWSLVDFDGSIWAADAAFATPDFDEFLDFRQVDLTDGSVREVAVDVDFSGTEREADGFCDHMDFLDGRIVCDQSRGAPFTFPLDGEYQVSLIPGLDDGVVRYRASQ